MEEQKPIDLQTGQVQEFSETDVWDALHECYDPEIPVNIVDLGLVYDVELKDGVVYVTMSLTVPGCGMGPVIADDVKMRLLQINGVKEAHIDIVFTPMWNPGMMTEAAKRTLGM